MTGLSIRSCLAADLPAVRELLQQLSEVSDGASNLDVDLLASIHESMLAQPETYMNLVAETDGQVVGFISVVFYKSLYHRGGTALINELVVRREMRGAGIGRVLIEQVVAATRERGMDEVEVGTERHNLAAQRFYQRCGFDHEYVLLGMELV